MEHQIKKVEGKHQRCLEVENDYYGSVIYRYIGEIDFLKEKDADKYLAWAKVFHPAKFFRGYGCKSAELEKHMSLDEEMLLPKEEFLERKKAMYYVILDEDNLDWKDRNQSFIKTLPQERQDYLKKIGLPVGHTEDEFVGWYMNSRFVLSNRWLEQNKEYIAELEFKAQLREKAFIEAVRNDDMSGLRKATAQYVDLTLNNQEALEIAIENDNLRFVKYLINKNFNITHEDVEKGKSKMVKDVLMRVVEANEKKVHKAARKLGF